MSGVWADFGLSIEPVREMVRQRLRVGPAPRSEGRLSFSPAATDALRSAYRFGMGEPRPEHVLIVVLRRGEGVASKLLLALGVDPNQVRSAAKRRALPREGPGPSVGGVVHEGVLRELDFEDS